MTPAKQQAALQGQSAIARKVYDATPIQEAWQPIQIKNALTATTRSSTELRVVRGCLRMLVDSGLVKEQPHGLFRRVEVREPSNSVIPPEPAMPDMPSEPSPMATAAKSSVELLADLAGQMSSMGKQLHQLARQVEEAALVVAQEQESAAAKLKQLTQLQTLLKSLSQEAFT